MAGVQPGHDGALTRQDQEYEADQATEMQEQAPKSNKNKKETKLVIRHLPHSMTEASFLEVVSPLPQHDYFHFVEADKSLEPYAYARAYISFIGMSDLCDFRDKFDGYVFVDSKGNENPALIEFAPYQKISRKKPNRKKDPKCGTIADDLDYTKFLEKFETEKNQKSHFSAEQTLEDIEQKHKERLELESKPTPLIESINEKQKMKARIKDDKRKKREDRKKKGKEKGKENEEEEKEIITRVFTNKKGRPDKDKDPSSHGKKDSSEKPKVKEKFSDEKGKRIKRHEQDTAGGDQAANKFDKKARNQKRFEPRDRQRDKGKFDQDKMPVDSKPENPAKEDQSSSSQQKGSKRYSDRRKRDIKDKELDAPLARGAEASATGASASYELTAKGYPSKSEEASEKKREAKGKKEKVRKDRLKNKERPAMQIYRPGMGKFSSQSIKKDSGDSFGPESGKAETKPEEARSQEKPLPESSNATQTGGKKRYSNRRSRMTKSDVT